MQRKLRRLSDRAAKDQNSSGGQPRLTPERDDSALNGAKDHVKVERTECGKQNHDAGEHPDIAYAVDDERLLRRIRGGFLFKPVADEEIRTETDQLPEDVHHQEVVRDDYSH